MKVPPQILLYELTRSSGDPNNLEKASRHLERVAKFSHRLYNIVSALRLTVSGNDHDLEHDDTQVKMLTSSVVHEKEEEEEED